MATPRGNPAPKTRSLERHSFDSFDPRDGADASEVVKGLSPYEDQLGAARSPGDDAPEVALTGDAAVPEVSLRGDVRVDSGTWLTNAGTKNPCCQAQDCEKEGHEEDWQCQSRGPGAESHRP